jgi:eukaryotic-like serine/threonine-protein kinase
MDRAGTVLGSIGSPDDNNLSMIALDPAGQRIVAQRTILGNFDIWILDTSRGVPTRLTFDPATDNVPLWFPDGQRVIFLSTRTGRFELLEKSADGAGDEHVVIEDGGVPVSWSPDGRFLVYSRPDPKTGSDLWMVPMNGERKPLPVVQTAGDQFGGDISPDGRWLVYESNESGQFDVYVQRFQDAGGKWQVSVEGGTQARWSRDGRELYFVGPDARLMATPVRTSADGKTLDLGTPVPLFRPRLASGSGATPGRAQYAVAPDGRFLVNTVVEDTAASPITVVVNWAQALAATR